VKNLVRVNRLNVDIRDTLIAMGRETVGHAIANNLLQVSLHVQVHRTKTGERPQVIYAPNVIVMFVREKTAINFPVRQRHKLLSEIGGAVDQETT
jgi:5,10-methylene-tetrahydrofolate dehydrogenase/methenyl tetrahydrofolate cyclohydrolase